MDLKKDFQTDCEKKKRIKNSACLPKDISLPFFTYGFFKPHQIAYPKIKKICHKHYTEEYVKGYLKHVNGMPVLFLNEYSEFDVLGNVLTFRKKYRKKAYEAIGYSKHMNIYKWEEIEINGDPIKTLVSSTPERLENFHSNENNLKFIIRPEDEKINIHNYDWRLDPLYDATLSYIHYVKDQTIIDEENGYSRLIKTQMLYTSLWTVIDRFLTFKYGNLQIINVLSLSHESYFKEILSDVLSESRSSYNTVFSAQTLDSHILDENDPKESALYYYTLRNNVIHSGKIFTSENEMLFYALEDLLKIFERVLDEVRKE